MPNVEKVVEGDTHDVFFTVRNKFGQAIDLTGSTGVGWAKKRGSNAVPLLVEIENAAEGKWRHTLTGLLDPGTYVVKIKMTKNGVQTTAPTDDEDADCLVVTPTIGA